ncbi:MAG: tetratricopeptide repeat protein [Rhizobiales bacterium]|nr:tetratricopeptide repeat protein [Hyphomicrobiales bacterium]
MVIRFLALVSAAMLTLAAGYVLPAAAEPGSRIETPKKLLRPTPADRTRNIDFLFGALKAAPDATSAKAIEDRIWALWVISPSDTATLLMTRVKTAMDAKDFDLAIKLLDAVVEIRPDYVEAWNRRATIYYLRKDYGRSIADIRQVLAREPRHFGAMAGLGLILQDIGEEKRALEIYRRALEVHPHLPKIPDLVKSLREKVEGRDI